LGLAGLFTTLIASGMRGQKKMNIFPDLRGQVNAFTTLKFDLGGKRILHDVHLEGFKARNAGHPDPLGDPAGGKKPSLRYSDIQGILQETHRFGSSLLKAERRGILLAFQMDGSSLRYLVEMRLHDRL